MRAVRFSFPCDTDSKKDLGILAFANALGDMTASLHVGFLLQHDQTHRAFTVAVVVGMAGAIWVLLLARKIGRPAT